jgi:hypothetical protein
MNINTEAKFWQALGAIGVLGGGFLLLHAFSRYGMTSVENRAILYSLMGSFALLAGALSFLTGRGLHAEQVGMQKMESVLLLVLAAVAIVGGAVTIVLTRLHGEMLLLDRMMTGMAGAFSIMFGLICLLGQRLMCHMHEIGGHAKAEEKAAAAAAK